MAAEVAVQLALKTVMRVAAKANTAKALTSQLDHSQLSTVSLQGDQSFAAFRSALGTTHDAFRLPGDTSRFEATLDAWRLQDLVITAGFQSGCRMERGLDRISRDGYDHVTLMMIRSGRGEGHANGQVAWENGEIVVLDAREPMAVTTTDNTNIGVRLPRMHLRACLARQVNLHGLVLRGTAALILGDHLVSLLKHAAMIKPTDTYLVARTTVALITSLLNDAPALVTQQAELSSLRDRARAFAASQPGLRVTPEVLIRELGVSRSALYRAFGGFGGVTRHFRNQRLDMFRDMLRDPAEERSVAQIAHALGFHTLSAASVAYEGRFGKTPGQHRRERGTVPFASDQTTLGHAYQVWLDRLQALPTA